jgi:DNA-binding transcriptional LysR family regulator
MKITHFNDLEIFLVVCQTHNMSAAARILNTSAAQVSKRLQILEQQLGSRLFYRSTRKLSLTAAAERFRPYAQQALQLLQEAEQQLVNPEQLSGRLRITTSVSFGKKYILPLVETFMARYPHVQVQLHLDDLNVPLIEQGFDLAIRSGEMLDSGLIAQLLFNSQRLLCASPAYLEQFGVPQHPHELTQHRCILLNQQNQWSLRNGAQQLLTEVQGSISLNSGDVVKTLALEGKGIAKLSLWHIHPELLDGSLSVVLKDWEVTPPLSTWLVYPSQHLQSAPLQAFIALTKENLQTLGSLQAP